MAEHLSVDACVWSHANNHHDPFFKCASEVMDTLLLCTAILVFDDGGHLQNECEAQIGERPSYPREVWTSFLNTGRVQTVDVATLQADVSRWVDGLISRRKPNDRRLLKVGLIHGGAIVTDDYRDFTTVVRSAAAKKHGLVVLDSCQCSGPVDEW